MPIPIITNQREVTREQFMELFAENVRPVFNRNLDRPDVLGIVCYENLQMDSSAFGQRTAMIYGPKCSYKTLETTLAGHLDDLPSQRQYPTAYHVKVAAGSGGNGDINPVC